MFSIFKKVKHKRIDDSIYISRSVADTAYISEFNRLNAQNCPVFLFCFFQQTITRLQPHV